MGMQVQDKATGITGDADRVSEDVLEEIAEWCGGAALARNDRGPDSTPVVEVFTGQGIKTAEVGDWIVQVDTVYGNVYLVLSDEDFQSRYEVLDDPVPEEQEV